MSAARPSTSHSNDSRTDSRRRRRRAMDQAAAAAAAAAAVNGGAPLPTANVVGGAAGSTLFLPEDISDRSKVYKILKSEITDKMVFDGKGDNTRKAFDKLLRWFTDITCMHDQTNPIQSGDWNIIDILIKTETNNGPAFKPIPYNRKPTDRYELALYNRIASLNMLSNKIVKLIITDQAEDIYERALENTPTNHMYISARYGIEKLYDKYHARNVMTYELCLETCDEWYFDQTMPAEEQFEEYEKDRKTLQEIGLDESPERECIRMISMLRRNSLYAEIIKDFTSKTKPTDDILKVITLDELIPRVQTFYTGHLKSILDDKTKSELAILREESKQWRTKKNMTSDVTKPQLSPVELQTDRRHKTTSSTAVVCYRNKNR